MKFKVGVYGSAKSEAKEIMDAARAVGEFIAKNDCILITGACAGIPYEATLSAKEHNGFTVGVSPASNIKEHKEGFGFPEEGFDMLLFTGFGKKGRNVISVRSCDAAIFISGGSGTLNEFTTAYDEGKVCGILLGTGGMTGIVEELEKNIIGGRKKGSGTIIYDSDPEKLIKRIIQKLEMV